MNDIMERKALILAEFGTYLPETAPVYELMYLSDKAFHRREDRMKAARDGKNFIG